MVGNGNPQLTCWFLIHVILNHISRLHIVCLIGWVFLYPQNHILKLSVRNSVVPVYKGTGHFRGWPSLEVSQLYNSLLLVASLLEKTISTWVSSVSHPPAILLWISKNRFFFFLLRPVVCLSTRSRTISCSSLPRIKPWTFLMLDTYLLEDGMMDRGNLGDDLTILYFESSRRQRVHGCAYTKAGGQTPTTIQMRVFQEDFFCKFTSVSHLVLVESQQHLPGWTEAQVHRISSKRDISPSLSGKEEPGLQEPMQGRTSVGLSEGFF